MRHPFIRVVVLAFDGAEMTLECLRSVIASNWPIDRREIVLVDNGSLDDVVDRVEAELPEVRLLEPMRNLGFAGGCNLGITSTRCSRGRALTPFEFVALVNNDATVAPNWLDAMLGPFELGNDVGAVSPKMLLAPTFSEVVISGLHSQYRLSQEPIVRVSAVRVEGQRVDDDLAFDEGFTPTGLRPTAGDELDQGTHRGGRLRIVRDQGSPAARVAIRLQASASGRVRVGTDVETVECAIPHEPDDFLSEGRWVEVRLGSEVFDVINNVGSELYIDGSAGDRGFLERDAGQYDEPAEVFAWCGGAVLLRKEYLDDVGLFDESFFLYYEDTDLSWRGRLRGWRYVYTPATVVRHRHAQSSVAGSDLFRFQVDRNRLLVLVKNAPRRIAVEAVLGELRRFASAIALDLVRPLLRLSPPRLREVRHRKRVLASFLTLLPGAVHSRLTIDLESSRRRVFGLAVKKTVLVPEVPATAVVASSGEPILEGAGVESRISSDSAMNSGPSVAVYNLYWDTLGGGEVVSGQIAHLLASDHRVTLLGPNRPDADIFEQRLGIDLSNCQWREVRDDEQASAASADYDVFVNCTYSSRASNSAPLGLYYVHFPRVLTPRSRDVALRAGLGLVRLAERTPLRTSKIETAERIFKSRLEDDSWVGTYTEFIANSSYTRKWIREIWHRDSRVIHPPVTGRSPREPKEHLISSLGRFFDPMHGHSKKQMEMLTVFTDMARSHVGVGDWRLSFVGGADAVSRNYVMRIRRAAQGLPVDVHVNAKREVVDDVLSKSSIYWHASGFGEDEQQHPERFEHFGISVVEAMAAGAVPLVYSVGGPSEIVRNGVDGFHWSTPEQLARLTRQLIGDESLMKTLADSAMRRAADFTPEVFDERLRSLVASSTPGS